MTTDDLDRIKLLNRKQVSEALGRSPETLDGCGMAFSRDLSKLARVDRSNGNSRLSLRG
jgi:hypothetical protein